MKKPMPPKFTSRINITQYIYKPSDNLFFDACIWLDLFGPLGRKESAFKSEHANLKNKISKNEGKILNHYLIIQEYFHRFMTIKKNIYNSVTGNPVKDLKEYINRPNTDYPTTLTEVTSNIQLILNSCVMDETISPNEQEILDHLANCGRRKPSLNDQEIIRLCEKNQCFLVTYDSDFIDAPVAIISGDESICKLK